MNFNGETGVYCNMHTPRAVRCCARQKGTNIKNVKAELLDNSIEKDVLKLISQFPKKLEQADMQYDQSIMPPGHRHGRALLQRLYTTSGYAS
jgi:hypothetical protein